MLFSLKLVYGDDIRKVSFDENLTISILHAKIISLFSELESVPFDSLYLYYVDDENDKVRIKIDLELSEAVRQGRDKVLKIFIINLETPTNGDEGVQGGNDSEISAPNPSSISPLFNLLASLSSMAMLSSSNLYSSMLAPSPVNTNLSSSPSAYVTPGEPILSSAPSYSSSSPSYSSSPSFSSFSSSSFSSPYFSDFVHVNSKSSTSEAGSYASPVCASVSTNTLIDAKDAATETPSHAVTQTTQTQQSSPSAHQTTQTFLATSSSTQTAEGVSATQTTQTQNFNATCATQTAQLAGATQTTQTQNYIATSATQTQSAGATQTTQTQYDSASSATQTARDSSASQTSQTVPSFYDSLAGTQFGTLLEKLQELGFTDREKCVQALVKYSGKLHEAIDELLLDQLLA